MKFDVFGFFCCYHYYMFVTLSGLVRFYVITDTCAITISP